MRRLQAQTTERDVLTLLPGARVIRIFAGPGGYELLGFARGMILPARMDDVGALFPPHRIVR